MVRGCVRGVLEDEAAKSTFINGKAGNWDVLRIPSRWSAAIENDQRPFAPSQEWVRLIDNQRAMHENRSDNPITGRQSGGGVVDEVGLSQSCKSGTLVRSYILVHVWWKPGMESFCTALQARLHNLLLRLSHTKGPGIAPLGRGIPEDFLNPPSLHLCWSDALSCCRMPTRP
jgi:hypothetical protein